jgi:hypothetical protein
MAIDVGTELEARLRAAAARDGMSLAEYVRPSLEALAEAAPANGILSPATRKPIWEIAAHLLDDAPTEEIERLPEDLSHNLDHYLFGAPRRPV